MRKFKLHDGKYGAALTIRVTPRSRKTEFSGILDDGTLRIRISAPPREGKANKEIIKLFHKKFKKSVRIISGLKSKEKVLEMV